MKVFEKNENIFKILSEAISEGIVVVNKEQTIVATNGSANEIFGYEVDELTGEPLHKLIPGQYHKQHKTHFDNFVDDQEKRTMGQGRELYGLCKDGTTFPVEVGLNPFTIYDSDYVMALVIDISERKQSEQELKHWAKIFDESLNEIFIFDAHSLQFLDVNSGALKNIGYSLEEIRKMTPLDIKPKFTKIKFLDLIEPLYQRTKEKLQFETVHERKDGSTYPAEIHLQLSDMGADQVFVAIILDITDRKSYTEKLEKTVQERTERLQEALAKEKDLNELKTKFLSLVSHEFKTPLSGILTSAALIEKYTKADQQEKRDKHLATIKNKVKYLTNILNDFLSVERLESGNVNYKFTKFPLSKVINEVIYDANMLLKDGQRIKYPKDIGEYIIDFDEKILELVLTNLIRNAIKYSGENTTIDLQVNYIDDLLTFSIIDEGIGIPEKEQVFIFKRYFRAENALLDQGTGIGLNIVKTHLENLGGTITFSSEENKGSTFTVQIPVTNIHS
ncbi:hypothetical protein GCM10022393_10940 [Aquimarina addita]|uniref:histidine kinase n=1 Tax=Aquimarina addita TaxID=870485 RepID=A0ABP7XDF2_9FLAO